MIRRVFAVVGAAALLVAGHKVWTCGLSLLRLHGDPEPIRHYSDASDWEES